MKNSMNCKFVSLDTYAFAWKLRRTLGTNGLNNSTILIQSNSPMCAKEIVNTVSRAKKTHSQTLSTSVRPECFSKLLAKENVSRDTNPSIIRKKKHGFTIIELSIVIGLITIVATLCMVNFGFFNKLLVRTQAEKIFLTCRYLQQCAITNNKEYSLTFDTAKNHYSYDQHEYGLFKSVHLGFVPGSKGPPSHPAHAIKQPITFANNTITFHPDGIIQAGTVYLIDEDTNTMYAISSPVSQVSYLRLYRYNGNWHCLS